jgi:hypothetical protein
MPRAVAQPVEPAPLRVGGVAPGALGNFATEGWQSYDFNLTNRTTVDRVGRLVLFFSGQPEVKYGRDIWVPAGSSVSTWLLVGPATLAPGSKNCEIETLLFDRTDDKERLLLPPTEEKIRSRGLNFRKREPITAVMVDDEEPEGFPFGRLPAPDTPADEAESLARAFRLARGNLSENLSVLRSGPLPDSPEALDSVEHFVIASDRIAADPVGMRTLRHWLIKGGKLWIMLDRVRPEVVAPLLGDALDFQVVDQIGLTTTKVVMPVRGPEEVNVPVFPYERHERPVAFVRVLLPDPQQAAHTIDAWPVWFTRNVGRGKVMFTTLGPRGWHRPRSAGDSPAKFANADSSNFPATPVPLPHLIRLAEELHPAPEQSAFRMDEFQPMLTEEIGYSVISRTSVVALFGGFLAAALALGAALRKARRPELLGWLGPVAAVCAAVTFFVIGEWSRRSASATVSVAQVVDAVAGREEATARGLLAVYRPGEGGARIGAEHGGFFELDMAGIDKRRFITTDRDAWHWEDLELPAGVRLAPFHAAVPLKEPLRASARFGPGGIEGKCAAGPFQDLADALLTTPSGRNLAVRMTADGKFSVGSEDVLPAQQYLATAVLNDQQQRRQELYRAFLRRAATDKSQDSPRLLVWARPIDLHFELAPDARMAGSALLTMPLQWEPTPRGERVHIPGPLISYRRVLNENLARPTFEATTAADMQLRFQLPASVLPLKVERARFVAKIDAPNREIKVDGVLDGKPAEILRVASPLDPLRIDVADPRLLQADTAGGLYVNLSISESLRREAGQAAGNEKWTIEYLELEVDGVRQ